MDKEEEKKAADHVATEEYALPFQWEAGDFISPFVATIDEDVKQLALYLSEVHDIGPNSTIVDLGCGTGSVLVTLHKTISCRGVGIDLDEELIETGNKAVQADKDVTQKNKIELIVGSITELDAAFVGRADVLFLYLLPEALVKIQSVVEEYLLGTGAKERNRIVVSNRWPVECLAAKSAPQRKGDENDGKNVVDVVKLENFHIYTVKKT